MSFHKILKILLFNETNKNEHDRFDIFEILSYNLQMPPQ